MPTEALFAACTPGLESVLATEAAALGLEARSVPGGCELEGPAFSYEACNLWLRTASRVLLRIATFTQPSQLASFDVAPWVVKGAPVVFEVAGTRAHEWKIAAGHKWKLTASPDAISMFLREENGRCTLSVDTSGTLLYQRGSRQEVGKAPMRETLAAGVLALCGYDGSTPLWDIMCGSGTMLIEGAEISRGLAAGRLREFAFEKFPSHDAATWKARERVKATGAPVKIRGTDLNAGALGVARRNARRAGVADFIQFDRIDATKLPKAEGAPGLIVANFPYGKRVGDVSELSGLFRAVGKSLKQSCAGWRFGFLMNSEPKDLGLPIAGQAIVSNGGIRCSVVWGTIS